jgi:hypothetical protein
VSTFVGSSELGRWGNGGATERDDRRRSVLSGGALWCGRGELVRCGITTMVQWRKEGVFKSGGRGGPGARAWQWHQKNGRWQWQSLKEEDEEGDFPELCFHSRDTCSIGRARRTGLAGQLGRKGRGGPGQAGRLG